LAGRSGEFSRFEIGSRASLYRQSNLLLSMASGNFYGRHDPRITQTKPPVKQRNEQGSVIMRFARRLCFLALVLYLAPAPQVYTAQGTCGFTTLASCPEFGCSGQNTDHGFMNTIKRRTGPPAGATLHKLTFDDFQGLQDAVDSQTPALPHGRGTDLTHAQRTTIETVGPNGIGEGDFAQLIGFISDDSKTRGRTRASR
jgi:hypothetical protein